MHSTASTSVIVADYGSNKELILQAEDFHLFLNNGKNYVSMLHQSDVSNQYENDNVISIVEHAYDITLNISNITQNDTIDLYIENDFKLITIKFGANDLYDDLVGGNVSVVSASGVFDIGRTSS